MKSYCVCTGKKGWVKDGDNWVCPQCRKPSRLWIDNVIVPSTLLGAQGFYQLSVDSKTFWEKLDARIEVEIVNLTAKYNIPRAIIERVFKNGRPNAY